MNECAIERMNELRAPYKVFDKNIKRRVKKDIRSLKRCWRRTQKESLKVYTYSYLNSKTVLKYTIKALNNVDGSIATDGLEIANRLNDYFVYVFTKDESLDNVSFPEKCRLSRS